MLLIVLEKLIIIILILINLLKVKVKLFLLSLKETKKIINIFNWLVNK